MLTGMAVADRLIILNSDGKAWRPNLHIIDACEAIRHSVEFDYKGGELMVLNVGSDDNNVQILDIAKTIQRIVPNSQLKFLSDNPNLDKEGLISDRKVKQAGADSRTYKVSFDKLSSVLPAFKCEWSIEKGIIEMVERFASMDFNNQIFKRKGFYRLQHLEYLLANAYVTDELNWSKNPPLLTN
jgi:nucleoside-diphosphate-sugar epimerase